MPQAGENHQKVSTNTKSVSKTLAILSSFNERTPTQRTSDIAAKLHMNISTVSRHLNTMLDWGFLMRDEETGRYSLGYEVVALAGAALQNNPLYRHAYPELQQMSYKYDVHCHMSVPRGVDVVHLISISCESTMAGHPGLFAGRAGAEDPQAQRPAQVHAGDQDRPGGDQRGAGADPAAGVLCAV